MTASALGQFISEHLNGGSSFCVRCRDFAALAAVEGRLSAEVREERLLHTENGLVVRHSWDGARLQSATAPAKTEYVLPVVLDGRLVLELVALTDRSRASSRGTVGGAIPVERVDLIHKARVGDTSCWRCWRWSGGSTVEAASRRHAPDAAGHATHELVCGVARRGAILVDCVSALRAMAAAVLGPAVAAAAVVQIGAPRPAT